MCLSLTSLLEKQLSFIFVNAIQRKKQVLGLEICSSNLHFNFHYKYYLCRDETHAYCVSSEWCYLEEEVEPVLPRFAVSALIWKVLSFITFLLVAKLNNRVRNNHNLNFSAIALYEINSTFIFASLLEIGCNQCFQKDTLSGYQKLKIYFCNT
jgi:hypothetical protein